MMMLGTYLTRLTGTFVAFCSLVLLSNSAHSSVVYSGYLPFSAPGVGSSTPTIIDGPWSEPAYTASNFFGTNTVQAILEVKDEWDFRVMTYSDVQNTVLTGGNLQEVSASITVSTMGQLTARPDEPFPTSLTFLGTLTGNVTVGTNSFHDGFLTFGSLQINSLEGYFYPDSGVYPPIVQTLTTTVPVSETGAFPINYSFGSSSFSRIGTTSGDFSNTLEFTSILLPSGNTPESEGWSLTFDNGVSSPNVVPEPSTLWLLGLAVASLLWRRPTS